jgi:hypothetical protein
LVDAAPPPAWWPQAEGDCKLMPLTLTELARLHTKREEALTARNDRLLFELRSLERAADGLPNTIDGARRAALVSVDAISTTFEAFDPEGHRLLLRCARPEWARDPVMLRRLARGARDAPTGLPTVTWLPIGDWPHLRLVAPAPRVVDRLPAEGPSDPHWMARLLGGALLSLDALHRAGLRAGDDLAAMVTEPVDGGLSALCWLDPFDPGTDAPADLAALGRLAAALDPSGTDPVAELGRAWADAPPPSAAVGLRLVQRVLADTLMYQRHTLALVRRHQTKATRIARLARLVRALEQSLPPPALRACLRAGDDGLLALIDCDGTHIRGGTAADPDPRRLPLVWTRPTGVEVQRARWLLRAWATRTSGDPLARDEAQRALGGDDSQAALLMRWLQATLRLRSLRLLLAAQGAGGAQRSSTDNR